MQVSPSPPPLRRKRKGTSKTAAAANLNPKIEREASLIVESSCDESLSLGASRPGALPGAARQGDGAAVSYSPLSHSSAPPQRESAWSATSAAPNVVARSSPVPTDMSPQSSTAEVQQQKQQHNATPVPYPNLQELRSEERGLYLIQLLLSCATAVANGNMEYTNLCLEQLSFLASLTGDSMQRVASYFMEGLAARITRSWPGVFKALHTTQYPSMVEVLSARQVFFNVCPYLKFAFLTINQAIMDSVEGEKVVHVVDLQAVDAVQWLALLQALRIRPGGPPHLKITGIGEKREILEDMGQRLAEEAKNLGVSFQFVPVVARLIDVEVDALCVKAGEAVAVSSVMRLHSLLNEEEHQQAQPEGVGLAPSESVGADVPKREVVNGVPNDGKERCVFRSIGGGAFERVENGEHGPVDAGASWAEKDRGLKRSRVDANGHESPRKRISSAAPEKGTESSISQGITVARQQQRGDSGDRSEVFDKERSGSLAGAAAPGTSAVQNRDKSHRVAMDKVLRMLKALGPKVMVVVEQESNHNGPMLVERFVEALHYYCALFDSLDSTLPQQCLERVTLEKHLFGVEIKNVVACEGLERVERHEKLDKWKARLRKAGFHSLPLSYSTVMQATRLLSSYQCEGYRLNEASGGLTLAWQDTPLYTASAWHA